MFKHGTVGATKMANESDNKVKLEITEGNEMLLDENLAQFHNVLKKHEYSSKNTKLGAFNSVNPKDSSASLYQHPEGDQASIYHKDGVTIVAHDRKGIKYQSTNFRARAGAQRSSGEFKDPGDLDKYLHSVHRGKKESTGIDKWSDEDVIRYHNHINRPGRDYNNLHPKDKEELDRVRAIMKKRGLTPKKESIIELIERAKRLLRINEINLPSFHGFKVGDLVKINTQHPSISDFTHKSFNQTSYKHHNKVMAQLGKEPKHSWDRGKLAQGRVQLGVVLGKDEKSDHLQVAFHQHGSGAHQNMSQAVHKDALTKIEK
jgi:hypothetical protein